MILSTCHYIAISQVDDYQTYQQDAGQDGNANTLPDLQGSHLGDDPSSRKRSKRKRAARSGCVIAAIEQRGENQTTEWGRYVAYCTCPSTGYPTSQGGFMLRLSRSSIRADGVQMSDGPNGVRGTACKYRHFLRSSITNGPGTNGAASACFPCATGLAASFDVDLGRSAGEALGKECRARGVHCLLGPTTNIQRHPCGGRGFESFSEGARKRVILRAALTLRSNTRRSDGRGVGEWCTITEGHDE